MLTKCPNMFEEDASGPHVIFECVVRRKLYSQVTDPLCEDTVLRESVISRCDPLEFNIGDGRQVCQAVYVVFVKAKTQIKYISVQCTYNT